MQVFVPAQEFLEARGQGNGDDDQNAVPTADTSGRRHPCRVRLFAVVVGLILYITAFAWVPTDLSQEIASAQVITLCILACRTPALLVG